MTQASAVLISRDAQLAGNAREALSSITRCDLKVVTNCDQVDRHLEDSVLVLAHLSGPEDEQPILNFLEGLSASGRSIPVICISDDHEAGHGVNFLQAGAADYLCRPLDLRRLARRVDSLTFHARYTESPSSDVQTLGRDEDFLYDSTSMADVIQQVQAVAPLNTTVLLNGETGTGKTCMARIIHDMSPRRDEPFMVVDCGALTPSIVESEMFGHVKGSFTGADMDHEGKFQAVGAGTLMIDEIDALPLTTQTKLLRAVDERLFEPVGSNEPLPLKARIIVATNKSLEAEVEAGRFRSDLYYRVNEQRPDKNRRPARRA